MTLLQLIAHLKDIYEEHGNFESVEVVDDDGWSVKLKPEDIFPSEGAKKALLIGPDNIQIT